MAKAKEKISSEEEIAKASKPKTAKKAAPKKRAPAQKKSGAAPSPTFASPTFASHVARIREAKERSDALARALPLDARAASVALLWEMVFDALCSRESLDLAEFNAFAGAVQKLSSARLKDAVPEREERGPGAPEISEETIAKIEEQLKLL